MKHVLLLALCAFIYVQGQASFSASVKVYDDPNMSGVMLGTINYDENGMQYRVDWQIGGGTVSEYIDFSHKLRYLYCSGTCQTETFTGLMPHFNNINSATYPTSATATTAVINGVTCTKYNVGGGNPVTAVWMSGGNICQADLATGAHWQFTGITGVNSAVFTTGWTCPKQTCNKMIDFVLIFDESGSIVAADFQREKTFAKSLAQSYTFGVQDTGMALVQFDTDARLTIPISYIQASFINGVTGAYQRGRNTCIGCGLLLAQQHLQQSGRHVSQVFIMLTDGQNNQQLNTFQSIVNSVHASGTIVFALGVGGGVNAAEINMIASTIPGITTSFPAIPSFSALQGIVDQLVQATCINIPGNPCGAGCRGFCSCGATCVCPSTCDDRNKCQKGTCTTGVAGSGCTYGPVTCNDGNYCTDDYCDVNQGCLTKPTVCTPTNECFTTTCNPSSGCQQNKVSCEDFNPCTDDTCHPGGANNGCDHPKVPCDKCFNITCPPIICKTNTCNNTLGACVAVDACDDGNACTDDTCDPVKGCVHTRKVCQDNNVCTLKMCNETTGCYFVPKDPITSDINDNNNCTIDTCNPQMGIIHTPVVCDDNITCTNNTCDPVAGCQFPPLNCLAIPRIARLLGTCYQALCNESRHGCYLDPLPGAVIDRCGVCNGNNACAVVQLPSTAPYIVAGGLLAVVIIGAVIAAVAIVSFAGKKGYDIWLAHKGGMSGAANNPLYNDGGLTGVNPTYTA